MSHEHNQEFFDDCPICQVAKKAQEEGRELEMGELKEAFKQAKEQGSLVRGEMFDEEEEKR
ncbi:MAG: hypothetical protein WC663_03320 [Patescibacteria group bacterium]|jgi:hypothetical protein